MNVKELDGCCALKLIYNLYCLGEDDPWSTNQAAQFDTLKIRGGQANGDNCTATILTLSDDDGPEFLKKQVKFITKRGFKLLGWWRGNFQQKIYLYGSKEFRMPRAKGRK